MPFAFAENVGQTSPQVRYIGSGPAFRAWFEPGSVVFRKGDATVEIHFENAAREPARAQAIYAEDPLGARANYLTGNDPTRWHTDVPLFSTLVYSGVWPGVELRYRADPAGPPDLISKAHLISNAAGGEAARLKAEYEVAPGADPASIRLRFEGAAHVLPDGSLQIHGDTGDFREEKPFLYQEENGERREVEGGFIKLSDGSIGFAAAAYDHTRPLVIDPYILFSGYFGGTSQDNINAIAVGSTGALVAAGWTSSTNLPASLGAQPNNAGGVDAFIAGFAPNGGALQYCTYLGGSGDDRAFGIVFDGSGNSYVTGWTSSTNFPVVGGLQSSLGGTRDAFVAKLNPTGSALIFSTYLGGSGVDVGYAITLDASGAPVVAGDTSSSDLPVTAGAFQTTYGGNQDAFVARLSLAGNALQSLTYLGGSGIEHASSVRVDTSGYVVVGGYTWSTNFPVQSAYQADSGGNQDGFVAKFASNLQTLAFSTYLGGSGGTTGLPEEVTGVFVDLAGNIVAAGTTSSANFPVTAGAFQTIFGGQTDGFISRFSPQGALMQSTFLGGSLTDAINAVALDLHGYVYVSGSTYSLDFPTSSNALQPLNAGLVDGFIDKLNTTLSGLLFGTYFGGSQNDGVNAMAVDGETSILLAGQTSSPNLPVVGDLGDVLDEQTAAFVTKLAAPFTLGTFTSAAVFSKDQWHVTSSLATGSFGYPGDIAIAGDWDGTGTKRIGVFHDGSWLLDINGDGVFDAGDQTVSFGQAGDYPIVGDWAATGRIALGLYRQGVFILDLSGHLTGVPTGIPDAEFPFGLATDIPVAADWDKSGTTKIGVFRNGEWLIDYNGDHVFNRHDKTFLYGQAGDLPVVGDWDSSGTPNKIGVYRNGIWILDYDGDNAITILVLNELLIAFGPAGAQPLIF
jgi:hypothetical protein